MGSLNLLETCAANDCKNIIFSSTCATYGDYDNVVLEEATPQSPINSYGASKRSIEEMLQHFGQSNGLKHVIFIILTLLERILQMQLVNPISLRHTLYH